MLSKYTSYILGLSILSFCLADDVLDYSPDFDSRIGDHDVALVEFFAPWCGHCKRLAPEYEKAATELKLNDPPVPLIKVDCTSDNGKDTCNKQGVSGYPTLKIFRQGEFASDYNGPRQSDGIIKYMKSQVGPASKDLADLATAEKFFTKKEVIVCGFFADDNTLKEEFKKVTDKLRETVTFCHSSAPEVLKKYSFSDAVVLFRPKHMENKFEENHVKFEGAKDKTSIESFIKKNYHGLVGHRTQGNFGDFKEPLIVAYFTVDYVKNTKGTNYWRNRVLKVAKSYSDKFTFAISDKTDFAAEMDDYGVSAKSDKPGVAGRNEKGQKFRMTDEFSVESFEKFIKDFLDGKLEPHFKSEPVPENNDGPVKVAVAQNFEELVTNSDKDILIEFYAPWCGHCKKLAPTFEDLGKKMENEDVLIVKMDATANDIPPPFEVQGFPTLFWLPKNDKKNPLKYEGGREVDDFVQYISKHSTDELKQYDRSGSTKSKTEL